VAAEGGLWSAGGVHWSLDWKKCLALAVLWGALAAVLARLASPFPLVQLEVGALAGLLIAALQRRSFAEAPEVYRAAHTAAQVRRAMAGTRAGRRAVGLQWVAAIALLGVSILSLRGAGGRPHNPAFGLLAGYFVLMAARDLLSIPGLQKLMGRSE
jgi:hypothetical protein